MKLTSIRVVAALAATNFILLSHFSKYRFDQLQSYNWDIALMLTPCGIVKNVLFGGAAYLYPYYFMPLQLPPEHTLWPVGLFIGFQVALSWLCLELHRRGSQ